MNIIETDRLKLRHFELTDAKFILELVNSPGWIEFIGDRNIKTEQEAVNYLQNGPIRSYSVNGFGLCMVETKAGTPVGMCGLLKRDMLECPDIGFAFLPQYAGKGYGYEIAKATVDYAKEKLNLHRVSAITVPANNRSISLLEKLGFKFARTIFSPVNDEELLLFISM